MLRLSRAGCGFISASCSGRRSTCLMGSFWPLVFATIAYYLYRAGSTPEIAVHRVARRDGDDDVGIGGDRRERRASIPAAPRHVGAADRVACSVDLALAPITISFAAIGIYSLVATIALGQSAVRDPDSHPAAASLRPVAADDDGRDRDARFARCVVVRAVQGRHTSRELARVPDLARHWPARSALGPARLGRHLFPGSSHRRGGCARYATLPSAARRGPTSPCAYRQCRLRDRRSFLSSLLRGDRARKGVVRALVKTGSASSSSAG